MPDDNIKKGSVRTRVNIYEEWEVAYWLKELGCSRSLLEKAVTEVGTSAEKVREWVKMHNFHI